MIARFGVISAILAMVGLVAVMVAASASGQGGEWRPQPPLLHDRLAPFSVALRDGRVLVGGGHDGSGRAKTAEVYDPATGQWERVCDMAEARDQADAVLLPDGRVLVLGGVGSSGEPIASAELFDPVTECWATAASMNHPRLGGTSTVLPDGRVLVAGGYGGHGLETFPYAEIYNPSTNQWLPTNPLSIPRSGHTANLLPDGRVLVAGGHDNMTGVVYASTEAYNPVTGTWSGGPSMATSRGLHGSERLPNGRILAFGGRTSSYVPLASAEVFDPSSNSWSPSAPMSTERFFVSSVVLGDGRVLVAGGADTEVIGGPDTVLRSSETFDPATGVWGDAGTMNDARRQFGLTLTGGCTVLASGGGLIPASADLFVPDGDPDGDGTSDPCDNCPTVPNPGQENGVHRGTPTGDHCEDPEPDGVVDFFDNCPDVINTGQENGDGDKWGDACDECPTVPTPWWVPPQDFDCDGYDGPDEVFIGTDVNDSCADTTTWYDERGPAYGEPLSPWPPDVNDDQWVNLSDVVRFGGPWWNKVLPDPLYVPRYDLNADGRINLSDIVIFGPFFNKRCTP